MSDQVPLYDNPYDPATPDLQPETPAHNTVLVEAIRAMLQTTRVCLPCQVMKVSGNQKVDIQPLLKQRYKDGTLVTLPQIQNVMVMMPMGANYSIKLPVAVGDTGIAIFCDRSLDNWSVNGGTVDPEDIRIHDLSDPIFIPGLVPFSQQTQDGTTDLVITYQSAIIKISSNGHVLIQNPNGQIELKDTGEIDITNSNNKNVNLYSSSGSSPFVLGDVLQTYEDALLTDMNTFATAVDTFAAACSSSTDAVLVAAAAPLAAAAAAFVAQLTLLKSQYIDTGATNILSQKIFGARS